MTLYRTLWMILTTIDAGVSSLVALYFIKLHARFGKYLAMVFAGLAAEAVSTRLLYSFSLSARDPDLWFIATRILSRLVKITPMIVLLAYLFGFIGRESKGYIGNVNR